MTVCEGPCEADRRAPVVIGLLGGIASGKSTVAAALLARGAHVLDADRMAHAALADSAVIGEITRALGTDVVSDDGSIDRAKVARRVFSDRDARARLEAIIHPRVAEALTERISELHRPRGARREVAVLDVPLLLEVGLDACCDELWFIEVDETTRLARTALRGWDTDELRRRESAQTPLATKRDRATAVIANDRGLDVMRRAIDRAWDERVEAARG